jgi:hypothetical protein
MLKTPRSLTCQMPLSFISEQRTIPSGLIDRPSDVSWSLRFTCFVPEALATFHRNACDASQHEMAYILT